MKGDGFYIEGKAESLNVDWLVDSGCTITILSTKRFSALSEDEKPTLEPYMKELKSVDEKPIHVLGQTKIEY